MPIETVFCDMRSLAVKERIPATVHGVSMILRYLFIVFCLASVISCSKEDSHLQDAVAVGDYLIVSALKAESLSDLSSGDAANVVRYGEGLKRKLTDLRPILNDNCRTIPESDFHDPVASHIINISCNRKPVLAIRLRYDDKYHAFHILGWWTSGL